MNIKLAEALLRRKELQDKVGMLKHIQDRNLFEVKVQRRSAAEGVDDIIAQVPKLTAGQVTQEHDWHARQLRKVDAVIQQANWNTDINIDAEVMGDYQQPDVAETPKN